MSIERIIGVLVHLNLSTIEAEIFIFIAKKGPQSQNELERALKYSRKKICSSLESLTQQSLILKNGNTFSTVPFEEALELLMEKSRDKAEVIRRNSQLFLSGETPDFKNNLNRLNSKNYT